MNSQNCQNSDLLHSPVQTSLQRRFQYWINQKSLQEIYVWNTSITQNDLDTVTKIKYYVGYKPDSNEIQSLNAPMILNENVILESGDSVRITHRIPGVTIRYTTNDSLPDSLSSEVYTKPVPILNHTTIKAIALKVRLEKKPGCHFFIIQRKEYNPNRSGY